VPASDSDPPLEAASVAIWLALASVLVTTGCPRMAERRPVESGSRIAVGGFSVLPPRAEGWRLTRRTPDGVWFDRPTPEGEWHTVMAFATLDPRPLPTDGLAAVEERTRGEFDQAALQGLSVVSRGTRRIETTRHRCVETVFDVEDPGVQGLGGVLRMVGVDRFCVERETPGAPVIHLGYSQRLPPMVAMLPIDAEGRAFLDSLEFETPR
jgi:hypothetical protein